MGLGGSRPETGAPDGNWSPDGEMGNPQSTNTEIIIESMLPNGRSLNCTRRSHSYFQLADDFLRLHSVFDLCQNRGWYNCGSAI
jgi:hypothetical protein